MSTYQALLLQNNWFLFHCYLPLEANLRLNLLFQNYISLLSPKLPPLQVIPQPWEVVIPHQVVRIKHSSPHKATRQFSNCRVWLQYSVTQLPAGDTFSDSQFRDFSSPTSGRTKPYFLRFPAQISSWMCSYANTAETFQFLQCFINQGHCFSQYFHITGIKRIFFTKQPDNIIRKQTKTKLTRELRTLEFYQLAVPILS